MSQNLQAAGVSPRDMAPDASRSPPPHHPRRPPAHKSVSLHDSLGKRSRSLSSKLHGPRTAESSPKGPASDLANPPSSTSSGPRNRLESSGESSDAGKWFERSNNNVTQGDTLFLDNDPPFFLRNSSSSETPPDVTQQRMAGYTTNIPVRPGLFLFPSGGSSEDFRSVIDDLTIENKKLKKKLKKYERLHDDHLREEKLFEVKIHDLPPQKKAELEETLRNFATSLDESATSDSAGDAYEPFTSQLDPHHTVSSYSSKFADSAYVSNSASVNNSSAPSGALSGQESHYRKLTKSQLNRQQDNIQSYLQDIPAGLLPKHKSIAMTDKSKKKLVVRRLEQIFAGKGPAAEGHQQPLQQEEVAQSAARADRKAVEASGQRAKDEGSREARIMPTKDDDRNDTAIADSAGSVQYTLPSTRVVEQDFTRTKSPNQRPTRPLDLDPHKAQVPAENIDYIRHLGFTPPDIHSDEGQDEGHGWMYLNLLAGMAQLHTFNVTTDFIKNALSEYSSQFELSHDGRKVRWQGSQEITQNSSNSSPDIEGEVTAPGKEERLVYKRLKTRHSGTYGAGDESAQQAKFKAQIEQRDRQKFAYKPLLFRKESTEDEDYLSDEGWASSEIPALVAGDSSAFASSVVRSRFSLSKKRDNGPIIFYNKAKFCTDLSGDRTLSATLSSLSYNSLTHQPVGSSTDGREPLNEIPDNDDTKGPLAKASELVDQMNLDDRQSFSDVDLTVSSGPSPIGSARGEEADMMDFEVSGLGNVHPDDHFAINVECRHARVEGASVTVADASNRMKTYPPKLRELLGRERPSSAPSVKKEIVSTSRKDLPASVLPPPSFFDCYSPSDEEESGSDLDSESSSPEDFPYDCITAPSAAPALLHLRTQSSSTGSDSGNDTDVEVDDNDDDDDFDEGSLDLLAMAREADPAAIHAREREYDANMAERLAEEIPAGSSAATAGGGSGFNSPTSEAGDDIANPAAEKAKKRRSTSAAAGLKRSRTSDSLAANYGSKTSRIA